MDEGREEGGGKLWTDCSPPGACGEVGRGEWKKLQLTFMSCREEEEEEEGCVGY